MNINDLKAEIARNGLSIAKLADMVGMDKVTLYSRVKGETAFKQPEIAAIAQALNLSEEEIIRIFFSDCVS